MSDPVGFQNNNYNGYEDAYEAGLENNSHRWMTGNKLPEGHADFMDSIMGDLESLKADYEEAMAALEDRIANCDDPILEQELKGELDDLKATWRQITHHGPGRHHNLSDFSKGWMDRISNMRDALKMAHTAAQPNFAPLEATATAPIGEPQPLDTAQTNGASETSGAEASGKSGESGGASGEGEWADVDIGKMLNQMSTDPQAVMDQLMDMPLEQRGHVMQMLNTQLQQLNQMFSMMSNMQKAMHDTAKAAINNMRV